MIASFQSHQISPRLLESYKRARAVRREEAKGRGGSFLQCLPSPNPDSLGKETNGHAPKNEQGIFNLDRKLGT